jgi:hypothetical protein
VAHRVEWRKVKLKATAAVALMLVLLMGPVSASTLCGLICAEQSTVTSAIAHLHRSASMALAGHTHRGLLASAVAPVAARSDSCRSECSLQSLAIPSGGEVKRGRQQGYVLGLQSPTCLPAQRGDHNLQTSNQPPGIKRSLPTVLRV